MPADHNTAAIVAAARTRRELTRARAIKALRELDRTGAPVTFELVAATAGISRSWLYREPDIRQQIQRLREATRHAPGPAIPAAQRTSDTSLHARLQSTLQRNRELAEENTRLRRQLAQALGQQRQHQRADHCSATISPG
jgi:hypothetical protein